MNHLLNTFIDGPVRYADQHHLWQFELLSIAVVLIVVMNIRSLAGYILRRLGVGEKAMEQAFVELSFPFDANKSAYATEQLHILLRGIVKYPDFWDKIAARKKPYSLELVATRDDGIRYILMIPKAEIETVQRNLLSFLPALKYKIVDDYAYPATESTAKVVELTFGNHFALPLQSHENLSDHDPIAYLTGHMTKLNVDELIAFQIIVAPVYDITHRRIFRKMRSLRHRIALNKNLSERLQRTLAGQLLRIVNDVILGILNIVGSVLTSIGDIIAPGSNSPTSNTDKRRPGNPYEQELGEIIKKKLDQHLYEVSVRILVIGSSQDAVVSRIDALAASFQTFTSSYQSITARKQFLSSSRQKLLSQFQARKLAEPFMRQPTIVASSELSDLYHFPETSLTKTEGFMKSRSRELPAPLSIKHSNAKLDVIVGANIHGGEVHPIGMTLTQRQRHTYVIGKTGTGKTTLLASSIYQDMANGKGLAVFDPHGDMFRELLEIIPEHRRDDVIVLDPSDREFPIGLNILDPGVDFTDEDDKQEWITSTVLSVFAKLSDASQWGPRMEHILRSTTLTALQVPNPSLYTLQRLLTDKKYQKEVAKTLKDPVLKQFWEKEFKMMGSMQVSAATAPLTHRLGHFITAKMSRHILLQQNTTVRISEIMDEGKILLINLSKGDIGEDQSTFFGTILTSFIWMAAYQRTKIPEKQRRDFFVYVDEFQNFATPQFGAITSEGRKFHISLIISHQNIAQIEDKDLVKIVAGNAATIICLKANPEDEAFILPYMKPEVRSGDIVNLAPYHFYMKVAGDESEDAFSGETIPLEIESSKLVKQAVINQSREQYASKRKDVEAYMEQLFEDKKPKQEATMVKIVPKGKSSTKLKVTKPKLHDL